MKIHSLIDTLEAWAPLNLAESWDPSGLQVGDPDRETDSVLLCLDVSELVLDEAIRHGAGLILSHHPMLFTPLKSLDTRSNTGKLVYKCLLNNLTIYSMHTNMDKVEGGMNDYAAEQLGMSHVSALAPSSESTAGFGRVGTLDPPLAWSSLLDRIRDVFHLSDFRVVGKAVDTVSRIALCTGSGASFISLAAQTAEVYITGDMKYHEAKEAESLGLTVIDAGHFAMERIFVDLMDVWFENQGLKPTLKIFKSKFERDPFTFFHKGVSH